MFWEVEQAPEKTCDPITFRLCGVSINVAIILDQLKVEISHWLSRCIYKQRQLESLILSVTKMNAASQI